jgi:hypothetical protein
LLCDLFNWSVSLSLASLSTPLTLTEAYVASILEVAQNQTLNRILRKEILETKARLYNNRSVVLEWENMLQYVHQAPRPVPLSSRSVADPHLSVLSPWNDPTSDIFSDARILGAVTEEEFSALAVPFPAHSPLRLRDLTGPV